MVFFLLTSRSAFRLPRWLDDFDPDFSVNFVFLGHDYLCIFYQEMSIVASVLTKKCIRNSQFADGQNLYPRKICLIEASTRSELNEISMKNIQCSRSLTKFFLLGH